MVLGWSWCSFYLYGIVLLCCEISLVLLVFLAYSWTGKDEIKKSENRPEQTKVVIYPFILKSILEKNTSI